MLQKSAVWIAEAAVMSLIGKFIRLWMDLVWILILNPLNAILGIFKKSASSQTDLLVQKLIHSKSFNQWKEIARQLDM